MLFNFNPRTPYGVRHVTEVFCLRLSVFQSTHPVWGATPKNVDRPRYSTISIHAPRMGCDVQSTALFSGSPHFNPRTPYGVRLARVRVMEDIYHFNPRTPYGVRPLCSYHPNLCSHFNPRTPYGVRRLSWIMVRFDKKFQSTHPVWGATRSATRSKSSTSISIHAPRMGCDEQNHQEQYAYYAFQSTHPVWGATHTSARRLPIPDISIHAPRMGCDSKYECRCQIQ